MTGRGRSLAAAFDTCWPRILRVVGLVMATFELFVDRMEHPEVMLVAGPMMGLANLLKGGGGGEG